MVASKWAAPLSRRGLGFALISAVFLLGCTPEVPDDPPLGLVLARSGVLSESGSAKVDFGQSEKAAVAGVTRLLGAYPSRRDRIWFCGVSVEWAIGFQMLFVNGAFVGWTAVEGRFDPGNGAYETNQRGRLMAGETCKRE